MRIKPIRLREIDPSDQRMPCSAVDGEGDYCRQRAEFTIRSRCSCDWPHTRSCTKHLARVVVACSKRCDGHFGGGTVRVSTR